MRSEKEMLDLILNIARNTDDVRAVVMNGSRVTFVRLRGSSRPPVETTSPTAHQWLTG